CSAGAVLAGGSVLSVLAGGSVLSVLAVDPILTVAAILAAKRRRMSLHQCCHNVCNTGAVLAGKTILTILAGETILAVFSVDTILAISTTLTAQLLRIARDQIVRHCIRKCL